MPFPWKKNRVTRISQIVADLQFQSPKRGGSLVVETGFPTSLIDLFVKNRNRFKKPKFKKPVITEIPDPPPPPPSPATSPPPISEPPIPDSDVSLLESPRPSPLTGEITDDGTASQGRVSKPCSGSSAKLVIVKLLTVAVLVSIVRGFTVGITVSAFALLFLEYAGKRVVLYLKPCSDASVAMKSQFQRVSSCVVWFQNVLFLLKAKEEREPATVQGGGDEIESRLNLNSSNIDEIEVVEAKSELGICCELDDDEYEYEGKVVEPLVSECKIKGSRSGRFKSKMMKKLMSKKFRASKKEKKEEEKGGSKENEGESGSEVSSVVGEVKLSSFEIEEVVEDVGKEEIIIKNEVDCGITCSRESAFGRVGNSGYTILVIIALAGLIVGRLPALFLTIVWCFLLKLVTALWRSQNKPSIKCSSVPNS